MLLLLHWILSEGSMHLSATLPKALPRFKLHHRRNPVANDVEKRNTEVAHMPQFIHVIL